MVDGGTVLGFIGALVASVFFGSNYVPTKNYPQGDGMMFVWVFSSGVLTTGIIAMFIAGFVFEYTGLIGGSLWATGNLCVIPIVKLVGLGIGLLLWGSTSLVTGFLVGKFGLLGVEKDFIPHTGLNWAGITLVVVAMALFFFIKPTLENDEAATPLLPDSPNLDKYQIQVAKDPTPSSVSIWDRLPVRFKPLIGSALAVGSGLLYGVNMVPMTLWVQRETKAHNNVAPPALQFVFSHFIGIYLYTTVVFLVYCVAKRNSPQVFSQSVLPAYISGAMWGIAQCGLMSATAELGFTTGFPIGSAGPLVVSSLWSVLYFREIRGRKNILLLLGSFVLIGVGITLLSVSHKN